MAHPAPHESTPFLIPSASAAVPSYLTGSSSESPSSSISSSSSRTVTGPTAPVPQIQPPDHTRHASDSSYDVQRRSPPPTYASLGAVAPPHVWAYNSEGIADGVAHSVSPPQSQQHTGMLAPFAMFAPGTPQQHEFGPTPLRRAETVPYASYIDAPGAPDARAWRRFVGALGLALLIFVLSSAGVALASLGEVGWLHGQLAMWGRAKGK